MDERLRELAAEARRTGAAADQAAWLTARQRAGELHARRLVVAALAGHAGARLALPVDQRPTIERAVAPHVIGADAARAHERRGGPLRPDGRLDLVEVVAWFDASRWRDGRWLPVTLGAVHRVDRAAALQALLQVALDARGRWHALERAALRRMQRRVQRLAQTGRGGRGLRSSPSVDIDTLKRVVDEERMGARDLELAARTVQQRRGTGPVVEALRVALLTSALGP